MCNSMVMGPSGSLRIHVGHPNTSGRFNSTTTGQVHSIQGELKAKCIYRSIPICIHCTWEMKFDNVYSKVMLHIQLLEIISNCDEIYRWQIAKTVYWLPQPPCGTHFQSCTIARKIPVNMGNRYASGGHRTLWTNALVGYMYNTH